MAVYVGKDEMGSVSIVGEGKATVDRLFTLFENGKALVQCGIRYEAAILGDNSTLPQAAQDLLAKVWTPEAIKAAQDKRDTEAAAELEKRNAASAEAKAQRAAEFEAGRVALFDSAIKALTEQRDAAWSAGDKVAGDAIEVQLQDLTALKDGGKTIDGQDPAEILAAQDAAADKPAP